MKSFKTIFIKITLLGLASGLAAISLTGSVALAAPSHVVFVADAKSEVCQGLGATGSGGCDTTGSGAGITGIIKLVIKILSLLVGIAAVIMIIIGGFKYITSQGEASNTASAKNTVLYAIIGLIIVALAQLIVRFTLDKVDNSTAGCSPPKTAQADGSCQ